MKTYEQLIAELDENQRLASRIDTNAVIAAGAGSGKTRVLAARFVYLIVEKGIPVDEILALTFTKKAASEMYGRIYSTLREIDHPAAREAVMSFHLARIDTIDAFCNSIARSACRQYGISPDFEIDNDAATQLAEELALPFFLKNRTSDAIRQFMKKYILAELSPSLFADTMVRYSPVSSPLDFDRFREMQKKEIAALFPRAAEELLHQMRTMEALPPAKGKVREQVTLALAVIPEMPELEDRASITAFIAGCGKLAGIGLPGNVADPVLVELKQILSDFKKIRFPEFLSLANYALNETFVVETFRLLAEFQTVFHRRKRAAGIMTFTDVSRLAVDALTADPVLRSAYKESISAVMIDEFQDDNAMQRNLLFLIAEKKERRAQTVPGPDELCPDKLFFVGDEKQSIYRFRGADVSVFRELARDLGGKDTPELAVNYRTESTLIGAFNKIFSSVFLNPAFYTDSTFPLYEASFREIGAIRNTEGLAPSLEVLLVNEDNFTDDNPLYLSAADTEAAEVAHRIRMMIDSEYPIRGEDGARPVREGDIAILFRSGTKQHYYEKHLRENNIPYQAESLRGLFNDAPINDIYALLRLAVYPADNTAYAILLRSPFVTVSDEAFALAVMRRTDTADQSAAGEPFSPKIDPSLSDDDRARFASGRELYRRIRGLADRLPAAELITRLWYTEGYRYAVLSDAALHRYAELYDYFFELARQADAKGETLATFLDRIAGLMASGDKIDGLDIPVERTGGVKLMTVHKSKGLEFPVVFLVDCGNNGNADRNSAPVYYSDTTGLSVNTGGAEDADAARSNYFYEKGREEEKSKAQAEIRRLLYVAMTRAETRLILSGTFAAGADPADKERTGAELREVIAGWLDKKDTRAGAEGKVPAKRSFFDFILPALAADAIPGVTLAEILPRLRSATERAGQSPRASRPASETVNALYEAAPLARYLPSVRRRYTATALHDLGKAGPAPAGTSAHGVTPNGAGNATPDALDLLLKKTGIGAADFGTWAHAAIEARFTGFPAFIPAEIVSVTAEMADRFMESPLGIGATGASWRRNEYGLVTRCEYNGTMLTVSGQIDLIFETDTMVYVVDFKTDKIENPAIHAEQMAVYRKAAGDLRKKPVETWLFYLRTGNSFRLE